MQEKPGAKGLKWTKKAKENHKFNTITRQKPDNKCYKSDN